MADFSNRPRLVTTATIERLARTADEWLCTKEVAELTKLSSSYFEKARSKKRDDGPPWYKVGGGRVRYLRSDIEAWLAKFRIEAGSLKEGAE